MLLPSVCINAQLVLSMETSLLLKGRRRGEEMELMLAFFTSSLIITTVLVDVELVSREAKTQAVKTWQVSIRFISTRSNGNYKLFFVDNSGWKGAEIVLEYFFLIFLSRFQDSSPCNTHSFPYLMLWLPRYFIRPTKRLSSFPLHRPGDDLLWCQSDASIDIFFCLCHIQIS